MELYVGNSFMICLLDSHVVAFPFGFDYVILCFENNLGDHVFGISCWTLFSELLV